MNSHRIRSLLLIVFIVVGVLVLLAPRPGAAQDGAMPPAPPAEIHLKSRVLTPEPGVEMALQNSPPPAGWHGLIQLHAPPTAAERQSLADAGVTLLGYIPNNTWLALLPTDVGAVAGMENVRWIGQLQAQDRLDPDLHDGQADAWAMNADGTVNVWLNVFGDVSLAFAQTRVEAHGGIVTQLLPEFNRLHATVPAGTVWALVAEDVVQWLAQAPPPKQILNDGSRAVIKADEVQSSPYNLTGAGVRAAMWDVGTVDATHPDFSGRVTVVDDYEPAAGHATHVAGIMGGDGSDSENQGGNPLQWRGMAPDLSIFSFHWDAAPSDHDVAINTYDVDISQNSWALGGCSYHGTYSSYSRDYDQIITGLYGRHIPVVFAAGNGRQDCASPYGTVHGGPQSAKNVITVGGIHSADSTMSTGSAWGPVADGRLKPELVAAGRTDDSSGITSTKLDGGYMEYSGTSMAAPAVSGSIGLMLERYHNACSAGDSNGNPLPSTTRALLVHTADDLDDPETTFLNPGPDFSSGYGRVNDEQAVNAIDQHREGTVTQGVVDTYEILVSEGEATLKVTMAWDDVAAEANAAVALVNNLDLELVAPDGTTVHGPWILDAGNAPAPATQPVWTLGDAGVRDTRNVIEQVVVDDPTDGIWTIRVLGSNVPQGPQSYSLVSSSGLLNDCSSPTAITLGAVAATATGNGMWIVVLIGGLSVTTSAAIFVRRQRS